MKRLEMTNKTNGMETEFLWRPSPLNVSEAILDPGSGHFSKNLWVEPSTAESSFPAAATGENSVVVNHGFTGEFLDSTLDVVEGEVHAVESRIGLACLMCLTVAIAIAGNFLVLLAITKTRSLRRLNNFLLVSLAVSDFLSAVTCMPLFITELFNDYRWILPNTFCSVYTCLQLSLMFLSTWNIAAISLERVFIITHPMLYQRAVTERRMLVFIALLWVVSLTYGMSQMCWFKSEPYLTWSTDHPEFCRYLPSIEYAVTDFVVCFMIPLCVMFGAYLKIYCIVQSQMSRIQPRMSSEFPSEFSVNNNMEHYMSQMYKDNQDSQFSTTNQRDLTTSDSECFQMRAENYHVVEKALRKISTGLADVNSLNLEPRSHLDSQAETQTQCTEQGFTDAAEALHDSTDTRRNSVLNTELQSDNLNIDQIENHDSQGTTKNYRSFDCNKYDNAKSGDKYKILENAERKTDHPDNNEGSGDRLRTFHNRSENVSKLGPIEQREENKIQLTVPLNTTDNSQLQKCELRSTSNQSCNGICDPDQNGVNQTSNPGGVQSVEIQEDQIKIQAKNENCAVPTSSGVDQTTMLNGETDSVPEVNDKEKIPDIQPPDMAQSEETFKPSEDDVFQKVDQTQTTQNEPTGRIDTLTVSARKSNANADSLRPNSHEGQRLTPRSSRCLSDPKPPTTAFDAGIEINISRASSKDGVAFPLRRASSARPDLNSINPESPTSTTYSGFGTKLQPVLKSWSRNASTGNLSDQSGQVPGRKRNSVVFRLYDDEILPDDDPNTVQMIPKLRVSTGTQATETSGVGTAETTLTPDNSTPSNEAGARRNARQRSDDPSKVHTQQWAKRHFNVSGDQSTTSISMRSRGGSGASSMRVSSLTRRLRENKAVRMTAAVIGAFVLCILPYKIVFLLRVHDVSSVSDLGWNIVSSLMFYTNALNPFIYNFYNSTFRAAIKRIVFCKGTPVGPVYA